MVDLKELYETAVSHIPESELLPGGHWLVELRNLYFQQPKEKEDGKITSAQLVFFLSLQEPQGDVDPKRVKELRAKEYDWTDEDVSHRMWFATAADKAAIEETLKAFAGVTIPDVPMTVVDKEKGRVINPALNEAIRGGQIIAKLKIGSHYRTKEPELQVEGFLPVGG